MPAVDLSSRLPATATWVKVRFDMRADVPGAALAARLWSEPGTPVAVKGPGGFAFVRLGPGRRLSYAVAPGVALSLKIVAYKDTRAA